jgi:hypothetical protein
MVRTPTGIGPASYRAGASALGRGTPPAAAATEGKLREVGERDRGVVAGSDLTALGDAGEAEVWRALEVLSGGRNVRP